MVKREFHCFDQQIVSFDGFEKIDLKGKDFVGSFDNYVLNNRNTEIILHPTDGLSAMTIKELEKILNASEGMVHWSIQPV